MSEEILKALTQLFAIISKQDGGASQGVRNFVISFFEQELDRKTVNEYVALYDNYAEYGVDVEEEDDEKKKKKKLTSVLDSVRTLKICRQINKTLTQKQKTIVLFKLLEMLSYTGEFTPQRMEIIDTVSKTFKISKEEYKVVESFAKSLSKNDLIDSEDILVFDDEAPDNKVNVKYIDSGKLDGEILFVHVKSVDLYFTKYTGGDEIYLNGQLVKQNSILLFSHGSVFRTPKGAPLYYSDLVTKFTTADESSRLSFNVSELEFKFPNGHIGLRSINISEGSGKLIGIMGASGAGKTTLLNTLAGLETPSAGSVVINGVDSHKEKEKIRGLIGYVAQDDLLIEDLSVFENLYYNAKLCFKDLNEEEIVKKVNIVLASLGLDRIAHLKVGSPLNKKISGGQRKRLNIALELIREPAIMFVDEPTSGLSSRDSENVIDLLKELSLKGKLIFVVIHQPSSDIYKMFDKMYIMDTGGYPVFYGNPVEAVTYFKKATKQVGSDQGQCPTCGNVNPEVIFNIIEARVVDEYGDLTNKRKISPPEWHELYKQTHHLQRFDDIKTASQAALRVPSRLKQTIIFTIRDFLSKISNTQYMVINLLEAPFLALLLALIVRYRNTGNANEYIFRLNDNVPAYVLIAVIIALFMGLTVSAEEIIRDRKIQKRETFLNLSRSSYIASKLIILFTLSAVQTITFAVIGNYILEIKEMNFVYWLVLFSVSCFANVLGLNISASFNSAVTVYIIIPLLLIPQMILSGAIFPFEKLNNSVTTKGKVPVIADIMVSRWAFEAITVEQFKSNPYEKYFFAVEVEESAASYRSSYWIPKIEEILERCVSYSKTKNDSTKKLLNRDLQIVKNELSAFLKLNNNFKKLDVDNLFDAVKFNEKMAEEIKVYLEVVKGKINEKFARNNEARDSINYVLEKKLVEISIADFRNKYHNERLTEWVKNNAVTDKIAESDDFRLVQQVDPIYAYPDPTKIDNLFDYRTHFYAPAKHFGGRFFNTLGFNVAGIWFMTLFLCVSLYYELLKKLIDMLGNIRIPLPKIELKKHFVFFTSLKSKLAKRKVKAIKESESGEKNNP
jgi:ABC-type multidrug transport system ATPase subunit